MEIISNSDLTKLRTLPIHTYDLNFTIKTFDFQFDAEISPLLGVCATGKLDILAMLLTNDYLDFNLPSKTKGKNTNS